jgi:hypothetical protein
MLARHVQEKTKQRKLLLKQITSRTRLVIVFANLAYVLIELRREEAAIAAAGAAGAAADEKAAAKAATKPVAVTQDGDGGEEMNGGRDRAGASAATLGGGEKPQLLQLQKHARRHGKRRSGSSTKRVLLHWTLLKILTDFGINIENSGQGAPGFADIVSSFSPGVCEHRCYFLHSFVCPPPLLACLQVKRLWEVRALPLIYLPTRADAMKPARTV